MRSKASFKEALLSVKISRTSVSVGLQLTRLFCSGKWRTAQDMRDIPFSKCDWPRRSALQQTADWISESANGGICEDVRLRNSTEQVPHFTGAHPLPRDGGKQVRNTCGKCKTILGCRCLRTQISCKFLYTAYALKQTSTTLVFPFSVRSMR